ncbi:hypothetical protein HI914_02947 [Erysiphe necator]|uniref:Putative ankyrin repeat protein n=1 Tax=Uncinula necator TaxID=52586 RepID=A0A0B1PC45_UNCNE|nr:hypothetical protein HI914_02947 [Erysiphe necator]KHJ34541.1 putative ankyrin repeat protein [Erysiphe necator]
MDKGESQHEGDADHEGASKGEQLIAAARGNNTDLLEKIIASFSNAQEVAQLLNNTITPIGNYVYHEAALRGNYEIIDILLDQEGFECDPISRMEGDTPLHSAVRFINSLPNSNKSEVENFARELISMMIESGSDPRIKNKAKLTPYQLADPQNTALRRVIQDAIDAEQNKGDFILENENLDETEYSGHGSASESDD